MAARTVLILKNAVLKLADTQAGLTATPSDFSCQVTSAAVNATPNTQTVPATFCAGESSIPSATGWELALSWLQDWDQSAGGLSKYSFDNDTVAKWFSLALTPTSPPLCTGQAYVVAGSYGGDAGVPLVATSTWPLLAKPTITAPTTLEAEGTEAEPEPALV